MSSKNITARKGDKFPAKRLDFTDIGKEIRVKTGTGAIVTDVLTFLALGESYQVHGRARKINVGFQTVAPHRADFSVPTFEVDPEAIVTVTKLDVDNG